MEIKNKSHWYDHSEYWTDNGLYLSLNHGTFETVRVELKVKGLIIVFNSQTAKRTWTVPMLEKLARELLSNNGKTIIKKIFEEEIWTK